MSGMAAVWRDFLLVGFEDPFAFLVFAFSTLVADLAGVSSAFVFSVFDRSAFVGVLGADLSFWLAFLRPGSKGKRSDLGDSLGSEDIERINPGYRDE